MKRLLLLTISVLLLLVFALANTGTVMSAIETILDTEKSKDVYISLRNGDKFTEILMNKRASVRTACAQMDVVTKYTAGAKLEVWTNKKESIITVNNNSFSGAIGFKRRNDPQLEINHEKVLNLVFSQRSQETLETKDTQIELDFDSPIEVYQDRMFFRKGYGSNGIPSLSTSSLVVSSNFAFVERGTFTMGDMWGGGDSDEKPTHKVTFTYNFYIGKYEVTFDEYDAFCEATGRSKPEDEGWGRGSRPVINVSWNDAIAYCNWLSEKEGLPNAYDSTGNLLDKDGRKTTDPSRVVGYRLPTEAEWEYSARGGNKSKVYNYAGSDNIDDVAWYWRNSGDKYLTGDWHWNTITKNNCRTQEVGKKAPNELGIYDMSGNVWEWCSDWHDIEYYSKSPMTNPYNSTAGSVLENRGGGWCNSVAYTRLAIRSFSSSTRTYDDLGIRICRTVID
ncbi:formylglycine-generating enzyme family protein [Mesotoga sp.]|uniref:formylglycine-generating enzyme family protein n=1 Tax=Mesotoga sp. TaxID=2053577 RepID=UPI00345EEBAF